MSQTTHSNKDEIREEFSSAMSAMYRREVPAYGALIDLVKGVNAVKLAQDRDLNDELAATDGLARISEERHGAIRLGSAAELSMMRRIFSVMGMYPVGYYDLSVAGIPVHSTAFRPTSKAALAYNPFRVFTSLLRLDLIADEQLRAEAEQAIANRNIFTEKAIMLVKKAGKNGHLDKADATLFVTEVTETFKWHAQAQVSLDLYNRLHDAHRLIADIVSFKGPHINHLTPRTLDIDVVQELMPERGITPKAVIEGPPKRQCPILLRQTSFKALEEQVQFTQNPNSAIQEQAVMGTHTARFGEIEQRGVALTPKGHALYDDLLTKTRDQILPAADGSNASEYNQTLAKTFAAFPDDWDELRQQELAYFSYSLTKAGENANNIGDMRPSSLVNNGLIRFDPIVYEDFLPVSAAGIFQSNLGDNQAKAIASDANQPMFELELGAPVIDQFAEYDNIQQASLSDCLDKLRKG
ncbi:MAG: DUF1338 domain-containing protein [Hyphomicrobiales bacterium]|nr:MAG: DUF1338 domain-containing protein [Hyphomicrobiales bacterium]